MRGSVINGCIAGVFLLLGTGLANLQIVQGWKYREMSDRNAVRLSPQPGCRGRILDRNGLVIAGNTLVYDAMVVPQGQALPEDSVARISRIVNIPDAQLRKTYRENYFSASVPVTVAKDIPMDQAIALEEINADQGGIAVQQRPVRSYPLGNIAGHLIGYLGEIDHWRLTKLAEYGYKTKDVVGYTGIEEKYDYYLRPREGGLAVEVDHRGKLVRSLGFSAPVSGRDITLTIDARLQKVVEAALEDRRGSVVIMNPSTGEILALASSPSFAPEAFVRKQGELRAEYFTSPDAPMLDRAFCAAFPPASVFKLIVATAGLQEGKVKPSTTYTCGGGMNVGKRFFKCWDTHGDENLYDALAHSCDVYFYHVGLLVGADAIAQYAQMFGLGRPTGIDLPYEIGGQVPTPAWKRQVRAMKWFDGDTANFSIGQGDLMVTPLQVCRFTAVFANQGSLVTPYVVKAIGTRDMTRGRPRAAKVNVKPWVIDEVRRGMASVVDDAHGTGMILAGLPVQIAGKTGTAQVSRGQPHAWFTGYFPVNKPRYVMCVFLQNGGGGQAACLLTRTILQEMIKEQLL